MTPAGSNPSSKRRDKLFIIAEILEIAKEGTLKTQIMYRANLSHRQLEKYLNFLEANGMLIQVLRDDVRMFQVTEKGIEFLKEYERISGYLTPH